MSDENTKVGEPSADSVHKQGTEHIKEQVAQNQEGEQTGEGTASAATDTKPEPITQPQPPASNPGSPDASGGIPKGAGGVSAAAHVESPVPGKEKRKSIVGTLRGFLGLEKKEKEAADVKAADNTVTGASPAVVPGAAGIVAGQTAQLTDRTKSSTTPAAAAVAPPVSSSEESKPAESKDQADIDAAAAPSSAPDESSTVVKDDSADQNVPETIDDGSDDKQSAPKKGGGKALENREAIPSAGGQKLGEKHWGESDVVPDNPTQKSEAGGVASAAGQPTDEVADNTAKNTGGASGNTTGVASDRAAGPPGPEKKKFADKLKEKLPFGKKE